MLLKDAQFKGQALGTARPVLGVAGGASEGNRHLNEIRDMESKARHVLPRWPALLLSALAVVGLAIGLLHRYGDTRDRYLVATQGSIAGLDPASTVIYRGVEAGEVEAVGFDPADSRTILVRVSIRKDLPVTRGTYARLRTQGLTGSLQIELNDTGENPAPLSTSDEHPARIPLRSSLIDSRAEAGGNILLRADELITRLLVVLDEKTLERLQRLVWNLETATEPLAGLEERLNKALDEVPELSAKAKESMLRADALLTNLNKLSVQMRPLAASGQALMISGKNAGDAVAKNTLPRLDQLLEDLQSSLVQLKTLSAKLTRNPRSLLDEMQPLEPGPGEPGYEEPR